MHKFGNRPGKLLSYTIKKEQAQHTIKAISTNDTLTYNLPQISTTFKLYCRLYAPKGNSSELSSNFFFKILTFHNFQN